MKKLLGVALMLALCASSAFAAGSPQRTVGLNFGTWTPQGFVVSADTTFLNGAVQTSDTTDVFDLTDCDWGGSSYDPNGALGVASVWVQGEFVSCDSVSVVVSQSFDQRTWFNSGQTTTAGLQTMGNQQAFRVPLVWTATVGGLGGPSGGVLMCAPFVRFIITPDGNTAARMAALSCKVVYRSVRESLVPKPRLAFKRVIFGAYGPYANFTAEKDTTSLRFTAPDTSEAFALSSWSNGPTGNTPQIADTTVAFGSLVTVFTDPSSADSVYVLQQVSADRVHWTTPALNGANLYGQHSVAVGVGNAVDDLNATQLTAAGFNVGWSMPTSVGGYRPNGLGGAGFARWILRGPASGEVMGGAKVWVAYWKQPERQ